ncbi:hypothetical protein G9A89_023860 [Geosiphon pyriformis]|nr:hypothetical protein G9A89_023860 [Geosiphon pyriformis]
MVYVQIAKLDNFTGKKDDTQVWLNNVEKAITANGWNDSLINKPQDFNAFKVEFLKYFSNNNSINHLVNTFTTMKQGETEAIQAIDANYFTVPQILNQFIRGLCSSILQHVCPLHLGTLQDTVTHASNFESAESKANHAQAINLVMNGSSELDSKLKQFTIQETTIVPKIKCISQYWPISSGSQRSIGKSIQKPQSPISNSEILAKSETIAKHLPANDTVANLSCTNISDSSLSTAATNNISTAATHNILTAVTINTTSSHLRPRITQNWRLAMVVHQLILSSSNSPSESCSWNSDTSAIQNPNSQNYLSLLVTPENATTNNLGSNQQQALTNNIPPATVTNDELLVAIFFFDLEEMIEILLFSRAALEEKPITTMYIDAKIDDHAIKLILDSGSAGSIITRQLMDQLGHQVDRAANARIITANGVTKTPIGKINNLSIKINGIMVPIKVLVIEATQYQALVGNDWFTCGHFKPSNAQLLIKFEKETRKLTWEAYQVLWADKDHNELSLILFWDDKGKEKENKELIWKTDNDQDKPANWKWEETDKGKRKEKKKGTTLTSSIYSSDTYTSLLPTNYYQPKLECVNYSKKLSLMGACCGDDKEYSMWNNQPCLAYRTILLDEGMWSNIPGHGRTCDETYELWRMAYAKAEGTTTSKLLEIKNNLLLLPKPEYIQTFDIFGNIKNNPEEFYKHYQHLAPTREEQEQCLEQLNTQLCQHCLIPCDF